MLGYLLLVSGWLIALTALMILQRIPERIAFVMAGVAVEVLGLVLLALGYKAVQRSQG